MIAARRARGVAAQRVERPTARGYPLVVTSEDHEAISAVLSATRALLRVSDAPAVLAVVATLVHDLGGGVVPARLAADGMSIQADLSLGLSEPMLAWAEPVSLAAMRLTAFLPGFVEDARWVLDELVGVAQRDDEATRDVLTGLLTRRAWMRRLARAVPGDSVCLIDLDHFKGVNDTSGHAAGDQVLRALGELLLHSFRDGDSCGRYGGDELACLTPGLPFAALADRCERVRTDWHRVRPTAATEVGLSIGVAQVGDEGGRVALQSADRAMYRAKAGGRDHVELAVESDYRGDPK